MLHPIMDPKRSPAQRKLVAPPATGSAASLLDDLPPPYVDERLVEPETREEIVRGRRILAVPASPEHGDAHVVVNYLARGHLAPGYTASTHLLTRAGSGSDFATDTCIRRSGVDPRTGSRYLEELAFEVVSTQSERDMIERAEDLTSRGVRRIVAIFVETREVCEWVPAHACFVPLHPEGAIEDPTLVCPLPVRAFFDAGVADDSIIDALEAKGNPRLAERNATSRAAGYAAGYAVGLAGGLRKAVQSVCALLGIPLGPDELAHIDALEADGLESLLAHLDAHRGWPSGPFDR